MRKILAVLLVICTVLCLTACGATVDSPVGNTTTPSAPTAATTPATAPTVPITPLSRREATNELRMQYQPFDEVLNRIGTPESANVPLDIPVYYERELLYYSYGTMFDLGFHASWYSPFATRDNFAPSILATYPTNAIRVRTNNTSYLVYDTDTGYRFYLFVENEKSGSTIGYPILIKKNNILSYSDFKDIQINDPIEKVETVDDIATVSKPRILGRARLDYNPVSSVHYLKDGILWIDYTLSDKEELFVSNITFSSDFTIYETSHKIHDMDLPIAK